MASDTFKNLLQGLCAAFLLSAIPGLSGGFAATDTICIQTFNAYGPAYSRNLEQRTAMLGQLLFKSPCEILQLQEVWTESHHDMVLNAIQRSLPFLSAARFDYFQSPSEGQSGLAIFTSEGLSNQEFEKFTVNQDGLFDEIRGMLGVIKGIGSSVISLRHDPARKIQMLNVHLHPSSSPVRIAQVTQLLAKIETMLPMQMPLILSGDFNFKPDSIEYSLLRDVANLTDSYLAVHKEYSTSTCTYCIDNPNHWDGVDGVIDYIFLGQSAGVVATPKSTIINLHGTNGEAPSDHYGIRSHLNISDRNPTSISAGEFENRRHRGIRSLDQAIATLTPSAWTSEELSNARQQLLRYKQRLEENNAADTIIEQLMIP